MDGEIGVKWIQHFDTETHSKPIDANEPRLLILDGHNSHYTINFLDYACDHNIIVICLPSHTTHALQGLDVVAFSVLKSAWSKHLDTCGHTLGMNHEG